MDQYTWTPYAWLVPILPAIAFLIIVFIVRKMKLLSALTAIAAMAASLVISTGILWEVVKSGTITVNNPVEYALTWLNMPGLHIDVGVLIDPLSAVMLVVVTLVALLVEIYSLGYMHGEDGFSVFFSYLSLFCTSMLGLVISNNYFQIFFFWELVGLCSYLLIGFYLHKHSAVRANKKAFITNRVGDFGFMLGIFFLFLVFHTFNFGQLAQSMGSYTNVGLLTLAAILIFIGPMAKSAQFPLHVWLPDAMEGPTPVSALIHAATMVAAGVYLIARGFIPFHQAPVAIEVVAYIGGFSAIFAALIALVQNDIKRILAFSTMSQLGYMVMALGLGSLSAGMFHLTTHAFFKALLFLGAGSAIHAVHSNDIWDMGGLYKKMKVTTVTFIIGAASLAGIFPLAGFWSKDEILAIAYEQNFGLFIVGSIVAFCTAFYMARLIIVAFFGGKRSDHHAHEAPPSMYVPLLVLSVLAVVVGFIGAPFVEHGFSSYVFFGEPHHLAPNYLIMVMSNVLALLGVLLAWLVYGKQVISAESVKQKMLPVYNLLYNKFYIDEFYQWIFNKIVLPIGDIFNWNDRHIVDGFFDGIGNVTKRAGTKLRLTTTGALQNYALVIFAAVVLIVLWMAIPALGGIQ
ncbi:MAG: NADH-quinone oxidoreductase subunit L [Bacillota bacterium]